MHEEERFCEDAGWGSWGIEVLGAMAGNSSSSARSTLGPWSVGGENLPAVPVERRKTLGRAMAGWMARRARCFQSADGVGGGLVCNVCYRQCGAPLLSSCASANKENQPGAGGRVRLCCEDGPWRASKGDATPRGDAASVQFLVQGTVGCLNVACRSSLGCAQHDCGSAG